MEPKEEKVSEGKGNLKVFRVFPCDLFIPISLTLNS